MRTDDIRKAYLDFFADKGHRICSSDSLVPGNDPTLLFTGAGMNQFKDQFMGLDLQFTRATTAQKCIRTGDIMNVGVTPSHHTFFEMMGNFSFGDYFKPEAIEWAWEFLTGALKVPESLLQATVYLDDDEAYGIWRDTIGLPENRITRLGEHDNFWPADAPTQGPNGPCGPCSEIFYDRGAEYGCGASTCDVTCECRRYVEIWNLVFTQFNRQSDGSLPPLPQKNIDTGMGLERMASVMQKAPTNMDIDIFQPLTAAIAEMSGKAYGDDKEASVLMRRVADHARAVTFCIADGVVPGNTHRSYVLKRLLRRAVVDGRSLGVEEAFLYRMVPVVSSVMGEAYPEVKQRENAIADTVRLEEEKFLSTLSRGLTLIDMAVKKAKDGQQGMIDGSTAFELYDTYGFPYELAEEVVGREGLSLDREGFDQAMEEARERARQGAKMKGDIFAGGPMAEVKKTTTETAFEGYEEPIVEAKVLALVQGESLVVSASPEEEVQVVLDRSTLYAESGGQVGDSGLLVGADNLVVQVLDVIKVDDLFVHWGRVETGTLSVGATVSCEVDTERRDHIQRNHTATHLLHWALHDTVGEGSEQRGSWVGPERLRFDFQHGAALSEDELRQVEEKVNQRILENAPVAKAVTDIESARAAGAMALFGEKYGDSVRMVSIGDYSRELCGGCHVQQTGELGSFRILSEESVAAGIRRIEACTGMAAWRTQWGESEILSTVAKGLKVTPDKIAERVEALTQTERALRKELAALKSQALRARIDELAAAPEDAAGVPYLALNVGEANGKELREVSAQIQKKLGSGVALLGAVDGEKVSLLCTVSEDYVAAGIQAGKVVGAVAPLVDGRGGGRPEMAQAGGKNPAGLEAALAKVPEVLAELKQG
ncbi:MAG: alanine--tRNA ligase [Planctomycetota bacterium]|jgi:alanyl-tRNA synthetase